LIGIITLNHDTFSNPTLYETILKLNKRGIEVLLFCGYQEIPIPNELALTKYATAPKALYIPRRPKTFVTYLKDFFTIVLAIKKHNIRDVFAIDPYGLVMAGRVRKFCRGIDIHYFSFEIFFHDEVAVYPIVAKYKNSEVCYAKSVKSIIIQDPKRQELLKTENNIDFNFDNWHLIPVSAILRPNTEAKKYDKSSFHLKPTDIVYIHSGSIASWTGIDELIFAIEKGLPDDVYILIHNRFPFNPNDEYYKKLIALQKQGNNVILHDAYFENLNDYVDFLSAFDFGIAIYSPDGSVYTGKNIAEIGLASGKFSAYMLAGLPSLLSECDAYKNVIQKYDVGQLISKQYDLHYHILNRSLDAIDKKICGLFYNEQLNPSKKLDFFIDLIINDRCKVRR